MYSGWYVQVLNQFGVESLLDILPNWQLKLRHHSCLCELGQCLLFEHIISNERLKLKIYVRGSLGNVGDGSS